MNALPTPFHANSRFRYYEALDPAVGVAHASGRLVGTYCRVSGRSCFVETLRAEDYYEHHLAMAVHNPPPRDGWAPEDGALLRFVGRCAVRVFRTFWPAAKR